MLNIVRAPKQYSLMLLIYGYKIKETIVSVGIITIKQLRKIYKIFVRAKRVYLLSILNFILQSLSHILLQKQNVIFKVYA